MRITHLKAAALAGALLALMASAADAANPRLALVIGESAYPDGALPTTANDAGLVAQVLQAAGFDVVGARDLDGKGIREAMRDFLDRANAAGPDMQAFVYVSGRALQYAGDNYLVPIDARIARGADAPLEAVKLSDFTHALAAAPGLARVVVIDGARANPYAQQGDPLAGGLALVDPEPNTVIAFNAAPGAVGVQDAGDYGVYAKSLSGLMRQGGVDVRDVFDEVRLQVNQQTQGAQIPWSAGKLSAPYFIFERAADAPAIKHPPKGKPAKDMSVEQAYELVVERDDYADYVWFLHAYPDAPQARRIEAILAARREALFWRRALDRNDPRAYWTYLRRYPHGPHTYDAWRRLDALAAAHAPPSDFEVYEFEGLPPPPQRELVYADRPYYYFGGDDYGPPPPPPPPAFIGYDDDDDWRDLPPPPRPAAIGLLPVLAVGIPLGIAARAYFNRPHEGGKAPASAPPPANKPFAPPPLPQGVHPVAVATPAAAAPAAPHGPGAVRFAAPPAAAVATPAPAVVRTPLPTPSAAPATTPAPAVVRTPLPTPSATPAPAIVRTPTPAPAVTPAPQVVRTPAPLPSATPQAPRPAPPSPPPPKPADTPRPAPHIEAPKPPPAPAPPPPAHVEAPKPPPVAPPPAPHIEAPKPPPPPHVEAPKPPPAKAACGHPGEPRC